jgi:hypothetical protein
MQVLAVRPGLFGELLEALRACVRALQVRPVRVLKMLLQILNGGLQGDFEHVVFLRIPVFDLLALALKLLLRLRLGALEFLDVTAQVEIESKV